MEKVTIADARRAFEEMHKGRNLKQHPLRGTYVMPAIAAIWNQHIRTLRWLNLLDETVKDPYANTEGPASQQSVQRELHSDDPDVAMLTELQFKIYKGICENLGYNPKLTDLMHGNPDIDSLDIVELVMYMEEEFEIEISDAELDALPKESIIYTFIKFIESKGPKHVNAK